MSGLIKDLKNNKWGAPFDLFISRIYQSNGYIDHTGVANYRNAVNAGIKHVHAYIFPDVKVNDPAKQVQDAVNAVVSAGLASNTIFWLDVERYAWSSSKATNQAFIKAMVDVKVPSGSRLGIYASYYSWEEIVGLDYDYPAKKGLPLWYAHYDSHSSFSDFKPYGGWSHPTIKQFIGDTKVAGIGVDMNIASGL